MIVVLHGQFHPPHLYLATPRDLQRTDGTPTAGKMAIRMTVDKPSYISAQDMVFKAADDNMRIADTRAICYQNTHPSWLEPLGEALAHMESIMEFIDGIASVSLAGSTLDKVPYL